MRLELDLNLAHDSFCLEAELDTVLPGVTALFGPSGAGKSTILRAIAGFEPTAGLVRVNEQVWQGAAVRPEPPHRRSVGLVFQDGRLFEHLSVAGNLAFAARRAAADGPAVIMEAAIDALELEALMDRRIGGLSGGERQRVAMARSLCARPRLLLMDEPLSGLDRARKAKILPMIAALPKRFGVHVLYVSHAVEEIVKIADDLITMKAGRILGVGPVAAGLQALDVEVTGHFEAGSVLIGRVEAYDSLFDLTHLRVGGAVLATPGRAPVAIGLESRVRIRARDVSVALAKLEGVSIRNQLPARIRDIREERGAYAEVALDVEGQELTARLTRAAVDELSLKPGREVVALIKAAAFDRRLERLE